jgi:outer membrane immunogenic protein
MKKVLLSALVSTVLVSGALANSYSPAFNGAYIGGGITYTTSKIKNSVSITALQSIGGTSKGVGFNGFLGYGGVFAGGFYLGGELGLGYDGASRNITTGNGAMRFHQNSKAVVSVAARLGYAVCNALPYVKVGFEGRSKAKLQTVNGGQLTTIGGNTVNANRSGFVLGGGLDYALNKNVFIRGEYTHTFGSKNSYTFNNVQVLNLRTTTDTFLIGAGYKF